MSKPFIAIVPGFWGHPSSFDKVISGLQTNHLDATVIQLPSWGCEPPTKTLLDDAQAVAAEITPKVEAGQDVVVVMHSAGGFIAPEGLRGLLAPDLAKSGRSGGVKSLVYISAPPMSIGEVAPPAPWFEYKAYAQGDYLWVKDPKKTLYSDLPDDEAEYWTQRLRHHPASDYNSPTTQEPWRSIPSVFLKTANDRVIPLEMQTMFAQKLPACEVMVCEAGHSPFLSRPGDVVKAVMRAVEMAEEGRRME
ncbi:MAG: hypothetical protein Q9219_007133 [cf. Caloplaca sp. 3 TL-2023]